MLFADERADVMRKMGDYGRRLERVEGKCRELEGRLEPDAEKAEKPRVEAGQWRAAPDGPYTVEYRDIKDQLRHNCWWTCKDHKGQRFHQSEAAIGENDLIKPAEPQPGDVIEHDGDVLWVNRSWDGRLWVVPIEFGTRGRHDAPIEVYKRDSLRIIARYGKEHNEHV